jgi:hypothetical protein
MLHLPFFFPLDHSILHRKRVRPLACNDPFGATIEEVNNGTNVNSVHQEHGRLAEG